MSSALDAVTAGITDTDAGGGPSGRADAQIGRPAAVAGGRCRRSIPPHATGTQPDRSSAAEHSETALATFFHSRSSHGRPVPFGPLASVSISCRSIVRSPAAAPASSTLTADAGSPPVRPSRNAASAGEMWVPSSPAICRSSLGSVPGRPAIRVTVALTSARPCATGNKPPFDASSSASRCGCSSQSTVARRPDTRFRARARRSGA